MNRVTAITSLCALMVLGLVAAPAADACTCVTSPNNCSGAATADAVFEATVEATELAPRVPPPDQAKLLTGTLSASDALFLGSVRVITLRDVKSWRGDSQTTVLTAALGESCGYDFRAGTRYLIVATRLDDGRLVVTRCGLTRPLSDAAGLLEYVQTLNRPVGQTRVWGQVRMPIGWIASTPGDFDSIAGARVTVTGPARRSVMTRPNGRFAFSDLPHGLYSVNVDVPDTLPPLLLTGPETIAATMLGESGRTYVPNPDAEVEFVARDTSLTITLRGQ